MSPTKDTIKVFCSCGLVSEYHRCRKPKCPGCGKQNASVFKGNVRGEKDDHYLEELQRGFV